jgi:hypothetical protein
MRVFLVEQDVDIASIVNPIEQFKIFKQSDILHSALVLDQIIFGSRCAIDWVLFTRIRDIKFDDFCLMEKYIPQDSKTMFSAKENTFDCFYCRPAVYTIFGNMSKTVNDYLTLSRQRIDIQWL